MPKQIPENSLFWKSIVSRFSWFLIFALSLLCILVFIKALGLKIESEISLNGEVVLSFIIAFFSLGLSVMFYFKTEETSNKFYDNTYKFTSDVSRTLGEIRGEFGQHLKHLDKGYNKIADAVTPGPELLKSLEDAKKTLEEAKTPEPANSKADLVKKVHSLERKIAEAEKNISKVFRETSSPIRDRALSYTRRKVVNMLGGAQMSNESDEMLSKKFNSLVSQLHPRYVKDLKALSYLRDDGKLSTEFIDFLRQNATRSEGRQIEEDVTN